MRQLVTSQLVLLNMARMMLALLCNAALLFTGVSADCPAQSPDMTCTIKSLFLLDNSLYMGNQGNGDTIIDFMHNKLIPRLRLSEPSGKTSFISFGAGYSNNPLTSNYTNACFYLDVLRKQNENGLQNVSLFDALQQLSNNYQVDIKNGLTLTIYTRANNNADIQNSANFITANLPTVRVIVVVLYNDNQVNPTWSDFPADDQFHIDVSQLYDSPLMADCVIKRLCQDYSDCGMIDSAITTIAPTQAAVTVTPKQPPKNLNGPDCQCDPSTSYTDIMLVIDTSDGMSVGLGDAVAAAAAGLDDFNLQLTSAGNIQTSTRLGLITYASTAKVEHPLGTIDNDGLFDLFDIRTTPSDDKTNLADALKLARDELNGTSHRKTSRPVILIFAAVYNFDIGDDPAAISRTFQENNKGVVIVFNYAEHDVAPKLQEVASPGYFINSKEEKDFDIQQSICDANCYCIKMLTAFGQDTNVRQLPSAGCYYTSQAQSNRKFSEKDCQTHIKDSAGDVVFNGTLATDRTPEKTAFLVGLLKATGITNTQSIIGLYYDNINGQYVWDDGQPLDCSSYCPWQNGVAPDPINQGNSVFLYPDAGQSNTGKWVPTQDNKGAIYSCEYEPCDSTNFCNSDEY